MEAHLGNPSTQKLRREDFQELEANLGHILSDSQPKLHNTALSQKCKVGGLQRWLKALLFRRIQVQFPKQHNTHPSLNSSLRNRMPSSGLHKQQACM